MLQRAETGRNLTARTTAGRRRQQARTVLVDRTGQRTLAVDSSVVNVGHRALDRRRLGEARRGERQQVRGQRDRRSVRSLLNVGGPRTGCRRVRQGYRNRFLILGGWKEWAKGQEGWISTTALMVLTRILRVPVM